MASTPNYSAALKLSLAVLLPLILTEEVSGYVSNYGGPPPDTTDSIQSRIIPPFSPSLELARSMGSSPVTPQGNESPGEESIIGDRYNSYIGGQPREQEPDQQLERPNGLEDGVPRGISIPGAAYPRDLVSDKGWPKPDINPLGELGFSDEDDEEEDEEDCPPRLDEGFIAWKRSNRVVRATLPHMVPSSCTPPLRCSVSTTVHRRVFLQDGDTLEVILQAPPDYTPPTPTYPSTTAVPPTSPSPTPLDSATGVYPEEDITTLPTSQPTQNEEQNQKYSSHLDDEGKNPKELGNDHQQQQSEQQQPGEEQYAHTGQPELQHQPQSSDPTQSNIFTMFDPVLKKNPESQTQGTEIRITTQLPRQQDHKVAFVIPTTSSVLKNGEANPWGNEETRTTASLVRNTSTAHNNKTHLFSRDDHHIAPAHSTNSPTTADRVKRDVGIGLPPHHILGLHPRPPAVIDDVGDVAKNRKASQHKEDENGDDDGGLLGHEKEKPTEEMHINPLVTSPLTIWRASVSEWSSCSTREGGQIGDTSPEGIVTITPRFLRVGTNYFIGRSSWSSTECFQLQVTVRSSECGEGSLCSGKGLCYANATMEHFQCKCCKSYIGSHCEEMDACISNPCLNNGMCLDIQEGHDGDTFQCLCRRGYKGTYCEVQTNLCQSDPCKNGATCTGNHSAYTCHCLPGWTGTQCTELIIATALATGDNNDAFAGCAGSPCNNGICVESANKEIGCFCHPGFGGQHCEFEYNECVSNPCENGGTCVDHVGKFECLCGRGYTGERCQIKYDLCTPDPCAPGRICVDKGNSYSCECLNGLSEDDCGPHIQVCNPNPCENGGTCWIVPQARLFYCSCRPGFTGGRCQGITLDTHDEAVPETVGAVGTVEPGPLDVHLPLNHMRNIYVAFATLASALLIFALVVGVCHCRVNRTYRKCFVKLPRPSKVLPSVRRPRPTSLFDKSRWERSGSLRLETDPDGAAMPMTCSNSDSDAVYYNVDVCDNQELPLIK